MKKLIFVSLMAMLTGSAWAEWVWYSGSNEASVFYDPATIRKDGNLRRVWTVANIRYKDGENSYRARSEFDCKKERYRFLATSSHSEPMAGGNVLETTFEENKWREVAPDTFDQTMLKIVCAK